MRAWPKRKLWMHALFALVLGAVVSVCSLVFSVKLAPLGFVVFGLVLFASTARYRARRRLLSEPFPPSWRKSLEQRVAYYQRLDPAAQRRFEDDVRIFLSEQRIFAAHGARLDDDTRVLIASSAAMLCHGVPDFEWPTLRDIVVYPKAFDEEYAVEGHGNIAGMVHAQGPILFSQRDLRHGFARPADGHNVALHELAHVLDFASGHADGVPVDLTWIATAPWVDAIGTRLSAIRRRRYPKVLREYAGTNEAELFAVAIEAFFERPDALFAQDPQLFAMLEDYLNQRPASR
ncbi:MAG: zinc-dependent peptidase [Myxococcales bacterium]|nr:zinc-dependent peptidase [Myxococcales bacterium]